MHRETGIVGSEAYFKLSGPAPQSSRGHPKSARGTYGRNGAVVVAAPFLTHSAGKRRCRSHNITTFANLDLFQSSLDDFASSVARQHGSRHPALCGYQQPAGFAELATMFLCPLCTGDLGGCAPSPPLGFVPAIDCTNATTCACLSRPVATPCGGPFQTAGPQVPSVFRQRDPARKVRGPNEKRRSEERRFPEFGLP